jgi:hypothetical protein
LQKISDYDSTKERTTQVELLRLIQGEGMASDEIIVESQPYEEIITEGEENTIITEQ